MQSLAAAIPSPILEPLGAQLRVPHRVLYRAMAEPELQRSRVFAAVGVVISAGVPEHVHVHRKIETCFLAGALDHLRQPRPRERRAALGHKHLPTVGPVAAQLPQRSHFVASERVRRRYAILLPGHVYQSGAEIDLVPPQFTQFGHPEPVARGHPDRQRVAMAVPASGPRSLGERLDLGRRQMLTIAHLHVRRPPDVPTMLDHCPQNRFRAAPHRSTSWRRSPSVQKIAFLHNGLNADSLPPERGQYPMVRFLAMTLGYPGLTQPPVTNRLTPPIATICA